jgi:hypothetical protein
VQRQRELRVLRVVGGRDAALFLGQQRERAVRLEWRLAT